MANINIRIDDDIKKNAEYVFAKLGMTPTTAIVLFYNQVIRTNSIPFELKIDIPNEVTMKAIEEVEQMDRSPDAKTYHTVEELMEELKK